MGSDREWQEIACDVLVIGSEAAGAKAAIEAKEEGADTLVVTKGLVGRGGDTIMAGTGVQAPLGHMDPGDSPRAFFEDVVKGGCYLNNQRLVERLAALSMSEVPKMEEWGAKFMKRGDKFEQIQYPGSSFPRGLRAVGVHGGLQWRAALGNQLRRLDVRRIEDVFITGILRSPEGAAAGAFGVSLRSGRSLVLRSKRLILATGGCAQIYRMTDASIDATGDGMAIAYDAGAELADMEFQQFFPFCCYTPPYEMSIFPASLHYNLHGKFYNALGEAFMERYSHAKKDWGLRDEVSRGIYLENKYGRGSPHGGAYLSFRHLPENLIDRFFERLKPPYMAKLERMGIDIRRQAVEVGPGAHYSMGGVRVNENCETSVPGLYAAGEVASGPDGAERIDGGPAITWCLTMGYIAGRDAGRRAKAQAMPEIDVAQIEAEQGRLSDLWERREGIRGFETKNKVKEVMWEHGALVRSRKGLEEGLRLIEEIRQKDLPRLSVPGPSRLFNRGLTEALEAINMVKLSEMVLKAALIRTESRGAHYRVDFPGRDDGHWIKNIVIASRSGAMTFTVVPPVVTSMEPPQEKGLEAGHGE
jgi:succinate dehydrogenase/fumarate reductase flavoprotein subunit